MALAALDVYRSQAARQDLRDLPARLVDLPNLHTSHSAQESMQLNDPRTPWLQALPAAPETVYIVQGEPKCARALAATVRAKTGWCTVVPELGERVRVD
jgi:metallo-beta-lactamase family protein